MNRDAAEHWRWRRDRDRMRLLKGKVEKGVKKNKQGEAGGSGKC